MALFNKESPPYGPVLRGTSPFLLVLTSYKGLTALFLKCLQGQRVVLTLTRPLESLPRPHWGASTSLLLGQFPACGGGVEPESWLHLLLWWFRADSGRPRSKVGSYLSEHLWLVTAVPSGGGGRCSSSLQIREQLRVTSYWAPKPTGT